MDYGTSLWLPLFLLHGGASLTWTGSPVLHGLPEFAQTHVH